MTFMVTTPLLPLWVWPSPPFSPLLCWVQKVSHPLYDSFMRSMLARSNLSNSLHISRKTSSEILTSFHSGDGAQICYGMRETVIQWSIYDQCLFTMFTPLLSQNIATCLRVLDTMTSRLLSQHTMTCLRVLHLHLSLSCKGFGTVRVLGHHRWLHNQFPPCFTLFSAALWDLMISRPVHSLTLSSQLFFCQPCLLPPFTVPCKMVLARSVEWRHVHTTAVCISFRWSGGLHVVRLPAGSWHRLLLW